MNRHGKLTMVRILMLYLLGIWIPVSFISCSIEPEINRPNIVLLVADDLGWNDVGYHGSNIKTPNIDKLGEEGAILDQFYAMPACTPTRASLMTGRYTIRYGLQISVIKPHHRHGLPADERILPQALKEAGYETAIVGKWHLGLSRPEYLPTSRGFDHQYGCYTGMIDYVTHTRNGDLNWREQLVVMDRIPEPSPEIPGNDWNRNEKPAYEKGYVTDLVRDEAIRVIKERNRSNPLFLYVPFTAPHTPLQAKESDLEQYKDADLKIPEIFSSEEENRELRLKRRRYYAALVSGMDDAIGEIMQTLKEQDMLDNTLVVFMSDNGGAYQGGNNDPLRGQKTQMYEGGIRVPAVISFPGRIAPGTKVDEPLHVADLYPTLLTLAGASLEQKHPLDGKNMWATVAEGAESPHKEILINAREGRSSAIRVGDWKLVCNGHLGPVSSIGDEETKYELFNLRTDPFEERNLIYENPEKLGELKSRLDHYTEVAVDPLVTSNPQSEVIPAVWKPNWWNDAQEDIVKAYCIDFNWGRGGKHGFAMPGLWADANPEEHIQWYQDFACNVVQTFAVSCNGYAWYKNGFVPEQPGLKYDFLPEMVRLGHERGMKVFGYFCAGANNRWEELHPDLSYQAGGQQIPYTSQYVDYLCASIEDAIVKTGMDGFMLDWLYNPGGGREPLPRLRWIPCEQEMYMELMGEAFPGKEKVTSELELEFRRKSIERAWKRVRETAKKADPACMIWLTAYDLNSPEYEGLDLFREADWVMNEAGDVARTERVNNLVGADTKLITCLAWNKQDAFEIVEHAKNNNIGLYGFTKHVIGNMMKPVDYYLGNPVESLENDERNIAILMRIYKGLAMDYVKR